MFFVLAVHIVQMKAKASGYIFTWVILSPLVFTFLFKLLVLICIYIKMFLFVILCISCFLPQFCCSLFSCTKKTADFIKVFRLMAKDDNTKSIKLYPDIYSTNEIQLSCQWLLTASPTLWLWSAKNSTWNSLKHHRVCQPFSNISEGIFTRMKQFMYKTMGGRVIHNSPIQCACI